MTAGSLQLRLFRIARRGGASIAAAAAHANIGRAEADLIARDDDKHPPAPDCYRLTPGMARGYVGDLADTPLGTAMVSRLTGE